MHLHRSVWVASRRDDFVAGFCGVWMLSGLFTDGWAHRNQKPETFFSPWHGLLYSGFIASALWILRVVRRGQQLGRTGRDAIPAGYGLRSIGVLIFGIAGLADFAWHSAFGIEVNNEALLSPPHLSLLCGGLLMAAGPIVSTQVREVTLTPQWRSSGAIVAALTFMVSVLGFFLMYLSPYDFGKYDDGLYLEIGANGWFRNTTQSLGVGAILAFSLLMVGGLVWMTNNVAIPRGGLLVLLAVPALLQSALTSFEMIHRTVGAVVAGLVAEATWRWVQSRRSSVPLRAAWVGGLISLSWVLMFLAIALREGLGWSAEFWAGSSMLAGLLSAGVVIATQGGAATVGGRDPS